MKTKGQMRRAEKPMFIMIIGLPTGTISRIYNTNRTTEDDSVEKENFFSKKAEMYEGPLSVSDVLRALKENVAVVLAGPFLIKKNRKIILDAITDYEIEKIALFDTLPYEFCRPTETGGQKNFEDYKKFISLPTASEGFTKIKLNGFSRQSVPEYYRMSSFARRNFLELAPDALPESKMGIQALLATKYIIENDGNALQQLMGIYSSSGKETSVKKDRQTEEITFQNFEKVSALDFYSYINIFIKSLKTIGFTDKDIFSAALAIQIHTEFSVEKTKEEMSAYKKVYGETVVEYALLLNRAYIYARKYSEETCNENIGDLLAFISKKLGETIKCDTEKVFNFYS